MVERMAAQMAVDAGSDLPMVDKAHNIGFVSRYALHAIIHTAYRHNPYQRTMHLYNAGFRGRELAWGYLDG